MRYVLLPLALLALAACTEQTPSGPEILNSGDGANICVAARDAGCVTPAPVVVPPVVIEPVIVEGAEG